jgi:uncharacterized membrane protein YfcA
MTTAEYMGGIAIFVIIVFANMSGLSGGLLTFVVLYELYGFEFQKILGYASGLNLIASIIRFVLYYFTKHPTKEFKTLIDYDMVLILLPMGIFGAFTGKIIYSFLPMIAVAIMSLLFYGMAAINILRKGIYFLKKENLQIKIEDFEKHKSEFSENSKRLDSQNGETTEELMRGDVKEVGSNFRKSRNFEYHSAQHKYDKNVSNVSLSNQKYR